MSCLSANIWFSKNPNILKLSLPAKINSRWLARFRAGIGILLLVGITGGIAALGNTIFPVETLAEGLAQDFDPGSSFLIRLRILHPILAMSMVLYFIWFALQYVGEELFHHQKKMALVLKGLCLIQMVLGFVNLGLKAPIPLQLAHLFMAQLIVIYFTYCWIGIRYKSLESAAT